MQPRHKRSSLVRSVSLSEAAATLGGAKSCPAAPSNMRTAVATRRANGPHDAPIRPRSRDLGRTEAAAGSCNAPGHDLRTGQEWAGRLLRSHRPVVPDPWQLRSEPPATPISTQVCTARLRWTNDIWTPPETHWRFVLGVTPLHFSWSNKSGYGWRSRCRGSCSLGLGSAVRFWFSMRRSSMVCCSILSLNGVGTIQLRRRSSTTNLLSSAQPLSGCRSRHGPEPQRLRYIRPLLNATRSFGGRHCLLPQWVSFARSRPSPLRP
mgnify:CR=1 FL=1